MVKKSILILVICLLIPFAAFSSNYYSPSATVSFGPYFAIPTASYLKVQGVPIRTQATANVDLDLFSFTFDHFEASAGFAINHTFASLAAGSHSLKSFLGIGIKVELGYMFSPKLGVGLGTRLMFSEFFPLKDRFASLDFFAGPKFLLTNTEYFDIILFTPLTFTYRKDLVAISLSCGVTFSFQGNKLWSLIK